MTDTIILINYFILWNFYCRIFSSLEKYFLSMVDPILYFNNDSFLNLLHNFFMSLCTTFSFSVVLVLNILFQKQLWLIISWRIDLGYLKIINFGIKSLLKLVRFRCQLLDRKRDPGSQKKNHVRMIDIL